MHLDDDALVTLISLLRINSQVAKGLLQRLFLNLCEDRATMESTLRILLSLLRAPLSTDEAQSARQEPAQQSRPASLSDALQVQGSPDRAPRSASPFLCVRHVYLKSHLLINTSFRQYMSLGCFHAQCTLCSSRINLDQPALVDRAFCPGITKALRMHALLSTGAIVTDVCAYLCSLARPWVARRSRRSSCRWCSWGCWGGVPRLSPRQSPGAWWS